MDHVTDFPSKLGLVLKAISVSRVACAQRLGVDKSLVGRWLSGAVHPTEHNLARITDLVTEATPGFRLADWYQERETFAARFGVTWPTAGLDALPELPTPLAAFLETARPELSRRASAYEGFWRTSRPSLLMQDRIFHDYGLLRRNADGLVEVYMEGAGLDFRGWLFPMGSNVFTFLFDSTGRTPMTVLFKGVSLPKATVLDGILMMAALDPDRTPAALPIIIERVEDLSGDPVADVARYKEILRDTPQPIDPLTPQELEARIYRDIGPSASMAGGEAWLTISSAHNLSRGRTTSGLVG